MPLLKREPDHWPDDVFDLDLPWAVVHVRSRHEKQLARDLGASRVPHYMPQVEKRVVRSGRTFISFLPLLSGYLFARAEVTAWSAIKKHPATVRVLAVEDQALLRLELLAIRQLQSDGATLRVVNEVVAGDVVVVKDGPFRDYRGVVLREARGSRLFVSVTALRATMEIEFDREVLRRDAAGRALSHGIPPSNRHQRERKNAGR